MVELEQVRRLGFGGYRVTGQSAEHRAALVRALTLGCNLLDTAATYGHGASEQLFGELLQQHPEFDVFVVTKAGYCDPESLAWMESRASASRMRREVRRMSDGGAHSIHPDFLRRQLEKSRARLRRPRLDAFLLHNPEHYFDNAESPGSEEEYYERIGRAFQCLEEQVEKGTIRYYGVSSNTLPGSVSCNGASSLPRLLNVAAAVSSSNHFRIIEFPFNLIEGDAAARVGSSLSLIDTAKAAGLVMLANRPLNAMMPSGPVRLATYEEEASAFDATYRADAFEECVSTIRVRLIERGSTDDPAEFGIVRFLRDNWMSLADPELVGELVERRLGAFLSQLYGQEIPPMDSDCYSRFLHCSLLNARKLMTTRAISLRRDMAEAGVLPAADRRPLALLAVQHCLKVGIGHVLVGMRRVEYVESLKDLFAPSA